MIGVVSVRNPKQKRIIGFQNIIGLLHSVSIAAAAAYIPLSAAAATAAYIPLSCVWLTRSRSRWHRSSVGTTFPLQLWRYHESEFVWRPLQLRQWYGEIQSQLPLSEMWPVVEACWNAAQTWTDLYGECYLQVSWWRVPYSKDRIWPVRRRRHRSPSGILRNSHCCMYNEICKLHCL